MKSLGEECEECYSITAHNCQHFVSEVWNGIQFSTKVSFLGVITFNFDLMFYLIKRQFLIYFENVNCQFLGPVKPAMQGWQTVAALVVLDKQPLEPNNQAENANSWLGLIYAV